MLGSLIGTFQMYCIQVSEQNFTSNDLYLHTGQGRCWSQNQMKLTENSQELPFL